MPFARVSKSSFGSRIKPDEIKMGWHRSTQKGEGKAIYFSVSRTIIESMGWEIKEEGAMNAKSTSRRYTSVAVMEGTGKDAGFLMLVEYWERDGYVLGNNKGATQNTSFSMGVTNTRFAHYIINNFNEEVTPGPISYTIDQDEKTILIECPDWFRYDPTTVKEPEPVKPAPAPVKEAERTSRPLPKIVVEAEEDDEVPKLNRSDRRRLASKVARALTR